MNELQKRRVIVKLKRHLGESLSGKKVTLLGLSFKPNTDDIRQSSSIVLASRLLAEGATVVGYDPLAVDNMRAVFPNLECADSAEDALRGAEAAVLVTEWDEFLNMDWGPVRDLMANPVLIDGRNALDGSALRELGFAYEGVGRKVV